MCIKNPIGTMGMGFTLKAKRFAENIGKRKRFNRPKEKQMS